MFFFVPLLAAVGLWVAQMVPVVGFILGTLGVGYLVGLLVHVAVVLLLVDAIRIKRMRPLLVVPALAYVYSDRVESRAEWIPFSRAQR
jgi:hypothetical protein